MGGVRYHPADQGSYWEDHGKHFVGVSLLWELDEQANTTKITFPDGFNATSPYGERSTNARLDCIREAGRNFTHKLNGSVFLGLLADRDIRSEAPDNTLQLHPDGAGATNIIRRYIVTSNPRYPREIIQRNLLEALNEIFGRDGQFTEIQVKVHRSGWSGGADH